MSIRIGSFLFSLRGIIPVFILALGFIADYFGFGKISTVIIGDLDQWIWFLLPIAFLGEGFRVYTVGYSPKGTSGRNKAEQVADELVTTGLYSVTRNPLYFGNLLIWLSVILLFQNWFLLIFFLFFFRWFYRAIIRAESQFLREKYGQVYLQWSKYTPVFFPSWSKFKPGSRSFNWYKVARKEKNGFAAILLVFPLIRAVRLYFDGKLTFTSSLDRLWLMIGLMGVAGYVIIKLIMRLTNWLDNPPNRNFNL